MLCLNDGFALVFKHTVILLLLADSCTGQGVEPSQTVVTFIGEDAVLPCHLKPPQDAVSKSFEWGRPDLEPRFVHVWFEGQNLLNSQNPSYKGRTSVSIDNLKHGDLSLKLSAVKLSDNGIYRCLFPSDNKKSNVELVVGSVSSPVIAGININSSAVVLQCESKGWYPEPEVLWLDGEGHIVSVGPTETVTGPDGLCTVSSRLTVEKRHSSSFTCRVKQKKINQTRETQISVSAEFIEATSSSSSSATCISIVVVVLIFILAAAAFVGWKLLNRTPVEKTEAEGGAQLLAEGRKMEDLEKEKVKLEGRLQEKTKEQKHLEEAVQMLTEQSKELVNQRDQLQHHEDQMMKNMEDIENKMKSVEKKAEKNPQSQEYCDMKSTTLTAKGHLRDRRQEAEQLHQTERTLLNKTISLLKTMTDRKQEVDNQRDKIREELEEIQRKLQSEQKLET